MSSSSEVSEANKPSQSAALSSKLSGSLTGSQSNSLQSGSIVCASTESPFVESGDIRSSILSHCDDNVLRQLSDLTARVRAIEQNSGGLALDAAARSPVSTLSEEKHHSFVRLMWFGFYFCFALSEIWIIYFMQKYDFNEPFFNTVIQNSCWIVFFLLYIYKRRTIKHPRTLKLGMYGTYYILGSISTIGGIFRMLSYSCLPATVAILATFMETVFETVFETLIMSKTTTEHKLLYGGAVILFTVAMLISLYEKHHPYAEGEGIGIAFAMISCVFFAGRNLLLKHLINNKVYGLAPFEFAVSSTLIPFLAIGLLSLKFKAYTDSVDKITNGNTLAISGFLVCLCVSHFGSKVCKYMIFRGVSAKFFVEVENFVKIVACAGSFPLFGGAYTSRFGCAVSFGSSLLMFLARNHRPEFSITLNKAKATLASLEAVPDALDVPRNEPAGEV